jgi:citrate lyase subunit beta/citryl-CoA lyase
VKPIRSFLYAPGNRERIMAKAPEAGADAVMFDLADSVPIAEKDTARKMVADALTALAGRNLFVKLNDADSGYIEDDLDAVARAGLSGVLLPEVDKPETVIAVDRLLSKHEAVRGLKAGAIEMILLLETASAIIRAYELATASRRVVSLCCGTAEGGDLIRSLGCAWSLTGPERTCLRGRVLLAARAAGLPWPIDGVYANLGDQEGLETEAFLARRAGLRGKLAIHPKQIEPIHRVFTPTRAEIDWSRRVLEAREEALARGSGVASVDGVMMSAAAAERARSLIANAAEFSR